ncbi:hypothetical protein [Phenylobacterium immobile]
MTSGLAQADFRRFLAAIGVTPLVVDLVAMRQEAWPLQGAVEA